MNNIEVFKAGVNFLRFADVNDTNFPFIVRSIRKVAEKLITSEISERIRTLAGMFVCMKIPKIKQALENNLIDFNSLLREDE